MSSNNAFRVGLIVNPFAGIGGSTALKGSDGADTVAEALARGAQCQAPERATRALDVLAEALSATPVLNCQILCFAGAMGEESAQAAGFSPQVVGAAMSAQSGAGDTQSAVTALISAGVDVLVFTGGDGTARDVCAQLQQLGCDLPVVGIPAGVKIHSGVYAISPEAAGEVLCHLLQGTPVSLVEREVRDIDEVSFREGRVKTRLYGDMLVPELNQWMQGVKNSGVQQDELLLLDIAADVVESMDSDAVYIMGPGSTTAAIMQELGLSNTLLGVDVVYQHERIVADASVSQLRDICHEYTGNLHLVLTPIGGQGHILGRGNQQLQADVVRAVGRENIILVATRDKISQLEARPLLIDSNDPTLVTEFAGLYRVIVGYHDYLMCSVR